MSDLKAYMVHDGEPGEEALLVIAGTAREARNCAWDSLTDCEFILAKADRVTHADEHIAGLPAGIVHDIRIQRLCDWRTEGDSSCDGCGLYTMDGQFPLCEDCYMCEDCGHHPDCATDTTSDAREDG